MLSLPEPLWSRLFEVREVLMFSFDFEALAQPASAEEYLQPSPWLPAFLVPNAQVAIVGRDATGGVYVVCNQPSSPACWCLHIDTRGHATVLGESLAEALALLIAVPYWHQLLTDFPADTLKTRRARALELEREVCDDLPALPLARADLQRFLELPQLPDPVGHLHELAAARPVEVLSPHGWHYLSPTAHLDAEHAPT